MRKCYLISFALMLSLLLVACGQEESNSANETTNEQPKEQEATEKKSNQTAYPLEMKIYDAEGNEFVQTFEKAPERAITNNPSSIEILLELGLEEKIVGILDPDNENTGKHAETIKKLNSLGDKMKISREIIVGQEPDIVIGRSAMFNDERLGTITTLNDLGINVYTQSASHINQNPKLTAVIDDVRALGQIFDVNDRAEQFATDLEKRYEEIVAKVKENKSDEKLTAITMALFDTNAGTFSVFNSSQGLQRDLLDTLNLEPAVEGGVDNLNYESLLSMNPDVIIYITADRNAELDAHAIETLFSEPLIQEVSAIKEKRVYETTYDDFMDYGPRIFDTLEMLSDELYGQ